MTLRKPVSGGVVNSHYEVINEHALSLLNKGPIFCLNAKPFRPDLSSKVYKQATAVLATW